MVSGLLSPGQSFTVKNDLIPTQLPIGLDILVGGNPVHNYPSLESKSNICNYLNLEPRLNYMYKHIHTHIRTQMLLHSLINIRLSKNGATVHIEEKIVLSFIQHFTKNRSVFGK